MGGGINPFAANPFAGVYGAGGVDAGQTGQNASGQAAMGATPIRTPAAIQAFKTGTGMSGAGNYGASQSQMLPADQAFITPAQVRMQNLKFTRRMSPVARAVVQSFAGAGEGADPTQQKEFQSFADRKAPGASGASGGYSMR